MDRATRSTAARALLVVSVLLGSSCTGRFEEAASIVPLDTPASAGAALPNLAQGADGRIYLSWVEPNEAAGHALRFSVWDDEAWSSPRSVASGEEWFVNWADFPSMAALEDGTLAAHWLARVGESTYAYGIELAVSHDGGASWDVPIVPHRDGTQTEHGFVSLVPQPGRGFALVWLDGRETAREDLAEAERAMTLRFATLNRDGRLGLEQLIDERVCDCCSTDAVLTGEGTLVVAYRDRSTSEIRDICTSRFEGGKWSTPQTVHADGWKINGCPVNGPALASSGEKVACAWYTEGADQEPRVYVAFSSDLGRTYDAPIRTDDGAPVGRVDLTLLQDGTALVGWLEARGEGAEILARRVTPSGALGPVRVVAKTRASRASGFPRLVRRGSEIFFAWTEPGEPSRVRTAKLAWK